MREAKQIAWSSGQHWVSEKGHCSPVSTGLILHREELSSMAESKGTEVCSWRVIPTSVPPHFFHLCRLITVVKLWHNLEEADFGLITFSS